MRASMCIKKLIPDKLYLKYIYKKVFGRSLNLDNPKTYNEKLQWLKLYDRNPLYTRLVDKYEVKKYVSDLLGEEYIIPNLGVWESFDDIVFDDLPDKFVLKSTHDSGGVVICNNKENFDCDNAKKILNNSLNNNFFWLGREWPYKDVKPRILAEKYMEDAKTSELRDYKFFCFSGKAEYLFVASDRQVSNVETKFDFFDMDYNHLDLKNGHPNATICPDKPEQFQKMIELAEKLSKNIPHVRVDFYEVDGKIYFGEMTFFHWSGFTPFEPEEWDYIFGEKIIIPEKRKAN